MVRTRHSPTRLLAALAAAPIALGLAVPVPGTAAVPATTVPTKRWAATMCPVFAEFVRRVQSTDELIALSPSPAAAKGGLIDAIDDAIASASDAVVILRKAGVPDSRRGQAASTTIAEEFRSIRRVLGDAQAFIASASVSDSDEFLEQLEEAKNQVLNSMGESYLVIVGALDARLARALRENHACRSIVTPEVGNRARERVVGSPTLPRSSTRKGS